MSRARGWTVISVCFSSVWTNFQRAEWKHQAGCRRALVVVAKAKPNLVASQLIPARWNTGFKPTLNRSLGALSPVPPDRSKHESRHSAGWMGIHRGHHARPLEWMVERFIFLTGCSAIALVFLIFLFVGREALPVLLGQVNSAASRPIIPASELETTPPKRLQEYLNLSAKEYATNNKETIRLLLEIREEAARDAEESLRGNPDATLNTTEWRYLLRARQWQGYDQPDYVWQPVGTIHKYNLIPLLVGSLKVTLVGLLFAAPLSLAAALYVSQLAPPRVKEWLKPGIEMLAGVPSVVLGAVTLLAVAPALQKVLGYTDRSILNALVAGLALGLTAVPLIFSIAEDALTSVPRSYSHAALALGASKWETAWQIVLPAAAPGVFAALVLGFGRCIGETMVVLIVSGNAATTSWSLLDSARTITATIAAEMAEAVNGGHHYRILFLLGAMLFTVTFLTNLVGDFVMNRLKAGAEGRR